MTTGNDVDVIVATFSPHHFEGKWTSLVRVPRLGLLRRERSSLRGWKRTRAKVEAEEVEAAKFKTMEFGDGSCLILTKFAIAYPYNEVNISYPHYDFLA